MRQKYHINPMISSYDSRRRDLTIQNDNRTIEHITNENEKHDEKSFISRLRNDKEYRVKFLYTTLILFLHIVLGWKHGQIGPSLLDLQHITQTRLDEISVTFTSDAIGFLLGSLLSGILFRKFNSAILFMISAFGSAVITIAIPYCSIFELMVVVFVIKGIFDAFVESIANAELFRIWKTDKNIFIPTLHFCYTFGASLSPLVTAPFLLVPPKDEWKSMENITCNQSLPVVETSNYNLSSEECLLMTTGNNSSDVSESRLYIAYTITGSMYVLLGVLFLYSFLMLNARFFQHKHSDVKDKRAILKPSFKITIVKYIKIASICFSYIVFESSLTDFLPMFSVEQLQWTKSSASYLSSLHWGTFAFGRFLSIFCVKFLKPSVLLGITSSLIIVSFIGILLSSLYIFNPGLWVSVGISGLVISPMLPSTFTWINSALLPVNGFVTSFIFTFISIGAILNPIILGYLMDNVDKMAFCYIILSAAIIFFIVFMIGFLFSKTFGNFKTSHDDTKTVKKDNTCKSTTQNIAINVIEIQS